MKNLTIRVKITIWFIVILTVITGLSYAAFYFSIRTVSTDLIKNDLIETVNDDMNEITFLKTDRKPKTVSGVYHQRYGNGYLAIDDAFLELMNGAGVGLYGDSGNGTYELIYGEDLIYEESGGVPFRDKQMTEVRSGPDLFYVYDRELVLEDEGVLWLRGSVDSEQRQEEMSALFRFSLFLLPVLILLAAAGGYLITRRSLQPINRLIEAAGSISSGSDLKRRIDTGKGNNEVQQLTRSFNGMMQRLDESFESEKQFTSDVSHELRTPMSVILAQCELALDEEELTEAEARDALEVIRRQGTRMNDMIDDMLMYTRIDRQHDRYPMEQLDLSLLVQDVCEEFSANAGRDPDENMDISLDTEIEDGIVIYGSDLLLQRLLHNLLENGVRYSRDHSCMLRVRLKRAGTGAVLQVEDHGQGIPEEHLGRIFDRFYQVDPSRSGEGTGLGLAMVKEIAERHGADITVSSKPGEGSCFTVRFRLA